MTLTTRNQAKAAKTAKTANLEDRQPPLAAFEDATEALLERVRRATDRGLLNAARAERRARARGQR